MDNDRNINRNLGSRKAPPGASASSGGRTSTRSSFWETHYIEADAAAGSAPADTAPEPRPSRGFTVPTLTADDGGDRRRGRGSARKSKRRAALDDGLDTSSVEYARGISHEEKRRRQNRRDIFQILFTFTAVAVIIALGFAIYRLTIVDEITITGSTVYSQARILNISGLQKGESIFAYDADEITAGIDAIPELSTVSVRRVLPSRIEIVVADHDARAALLAANDTYTLIDGSGFVLSIGQNSSRGLPVIHGLTGSGFAPNTCITDDAFNVRTQTAVRLVNAVAESSLGGEVLEIDVANSAYIKLVLKNGFTVALGDFTSAVENIPTAAKAYALFLPKYPEGGLINVFAGSTIVDFTPNGIEYTKTEAPITPAPETGGITPDASVGGSPDASPTAPAVTDETGLPQQTSEP